MWSGQRFDLPPNGTSHQLGGSAFGNPSVYSTPADTSFPGPFSATTNFFSGSNDALGSNPMYPYSIASGNPTLGSLAYPSYFQDGNVQDGSGYYSAGGAVSGEVLPNGVPTNGYTS